MNVEVAQRLAAIRREQGYSQEELAERLGLSRQAVSKWERAESSPDTGNLIALAKLYSVSLDDLPHRRGRGGRQWRSRERTRGRHRRGRRRRRAAVRIRQWGRRPRGAGGSGLAGSRDNRAGAPGPPAQLIRSPSPCGDPTTARPRTPAACATRAATKRLRSASPQAYGAQSRRHAVPGRRSRTPCFACSCVPRGRLPLRVVASRLVRLPDHPACTIGSAHIIENGPNYRANRR